MKEGFELSRTWLTYDELDMLNYVAWCYLTGEEVKEHLANEDALRSAFEKTENVLHYQEEH